MRQVSTPNFSEPTTAPLADGMAVLAEWADRIRQAQHARTALYIRGGGTKPTVSKGIQTSTPTLDTRAYHGVVVYEPSELVVTVRAGTLLSVLESQLAQHGQSLPFEPPRFGSSGTVGGMVAAGLSGPSRASVGAVRDYVLGAQLINGRGEHLTFGGQVMKNVAGYDVSRVLAGSRGSLGVITEVSLKVLPVAVAETTLCFHMAQGRALEQLAQWRSRPLPLNASCWVLDATQAPPQAVLYVRLRGAKAAVEAACVQMLKECPGQRLDGAGTRTDWDACRDQYLPFFTPPTPQSALWRLSVPPTTPPLEGLGPTLVEWHGGQRWVWAPLSSAHGLHATAKAVGGHATLFREPQGGSGATVPHQTAPSDAVLAIQRRLKTAFDPAGILNPGIWGEGF